MQNSKIRDIKVHLVFRPVAGGFSDVTRKVETAVIAIIHQELGLIQTLTVCENIFLGDEACRNGLIDWDFEYDRAKELLGELKLKVTPRTRVGNLGIGQQQLVEIAKALNKNCKILILDEPIAPLPEDDSENLLNLIRGLRDKGMSVVFITHKLGEVLSVADTVTILRDGQTVDTRPAKEYSQDGVDRDPRGGCHGNPLRL